MIDVKQYIPFLIKLGITQEEFLLLYLLYLAEYIDTSHFDLLGAYIKHFGKDIDGKRIMITEAEKASLVQRGWLQKGGAAGYTVTPKFANHFSNMDLGEEFICSYPAFTKINNINIPLISGNRQEIKKAYVTMIANSLSEHNEMLADLKYAITHNLINMKITNYLSSHFYKSIREMRLKDTSDPSTINFNQMINK